MTPRRLLVHVTRSALVHDSRLFKEARSAVRSGAADEALLIGLWRPDLSMVDEFESKVSLRRIRLRSRPLPKWLASQTIKYFEWMARVLAVMRRLRPGIVHAHSLPALPIAVLASWLYGCRVVYDAHELESQKNGLRGIRQLLAELTERALVRRAHLMLVVGDGIADWYAAHYQMPRPMVVRNVPNAAPSLPESRERSIRRACGIDSSATLFLYLGVLGRGRSIERLCRVFSCVASDRHLVLMGYGELEALVREYAAKYPNIHFMEAVPPGEVASHARQADVGLCLIEGICLSYELSLPNKMFQCLMEGVPILINDLPEQSRFVSELGCGWIAPEDDARFARLIEAIDPDDIATRRARAVEVSRTISWDAEIEPYLQFCRRCLNVARSSH
jgi:glycosyltransferase involved in cell wall biosynthesis